jgi:chitodextrinase
MHETGHIFYATDEYISTPWYSGYLNTPSNPGSTCIMNANDPGHVCSWTRDQLGWRDLDGNGIIEPLDVPPVLDVTPGGATSWTGAARAVALTNLNSRSAYVPPHNITIATINSVEFRVDGNPWTVATPVDGAFDGYEESFSWTPPPLCDGTHILQARARTSAGAYSETWRDTVIVAPVGVDCPPWLEAPEHAEVSEGSRLRFEVSVTDPDGAPIQELRADLTQLPSVGDFNFETANDLQSGVFSWTPTFADSGGYLVSFHATNSQSGSATTRIHVRNTDRAPVVTAPEAVEVFTGLGVSFSVSAEDPDGDPILLLVATQKPPFLTLTPNPTNTGATVEATPADADVGSYTVVFVASNALSSSEARTSLTVIPRLPAPIVTAPATRSVEVGATLAFTVEAYDPNGDYVELSATGLPLGAEFRDNGGDYTGSFEWSPTTDAVAGSPYSVLFTATNSQGYVGTATTLITVGVANVNRPPVANPGGPYTGVTGVPVPFDGAASSDPDGDPLRFEWEFGDGKGATGASPSHTYDSAGTFSVTLTVSDQMVPELTGVSQTVANISAVFPARPFVGTKENKAIRLMARRDWCVQVEPLPGTFSLSEIDVASARLTYEGGTISTIASRSTTGTDVDKNGIQEITLCFSKVDLRVLFDALPHGSTRVVPTVRGDLTQGGWFGGEIPIDVLASGDPKLAVAVSPNPTRGSTVLTTHLDHPGRISVALYSQSGRLVRKLLEMNGAPAGYHDVPVNIPRAGLAAGVYFLRVEAAGQTVTRKLVLLR